jgi:hypothetical protein
VALRSVSQEEPRLPEARVVTLSDADSSATQTDTHPDHAAAVWPKKMRVLAMIPQLSDGSGTGGRTLGLTAQRRIAALTEELLGKGTTSVNSTFGAGSFNQLQLSKAHSQVIHLPLLNHSYTELLNTCHGSGHIGGEHCCEKNGDALKAAMLAKLPEGVRTKDFDILVYYLRGDLLGCPSGRDGYSYFGTTPPNRAAPAFKVRRDTTAWKAGVTMYEGGINNAGTLARAIGHSLGLHHAGGEGPKQPPKAAEGAFTEFSMAGDGAVQKKSTTYGEEDAFMGSVRNDPTGDTTPQAKTFTAPVSSYLGFLPDEQVIQAISVGDEVHSLAELRAYELGPMGHQGDGLAMRIPCPDGCKPKVADSEELFEAYPREGRSLWASFLDHPSGEPELARKVHVHFSASSGGDAGVFTERWRYLAAGESFSPKDNLAIYVCEIEGLTATVSAGTSVSNAQSLCGSKPQTADIRVATGAAAMGLRRTVPQNTDAQDGPHERHLPECSNDNGCGHCLRALKAEECPADLASALADGGFLPPVRPRRARGRALRGHRRLRRLEDPTQLRVGEGHLRAPGVPRLDARLAHHLGHHRGRARQ